MVRCLVKTSKTFLVAAAICLAQMLFAACTPSVPPTKPLTPELQEQIKQEDLSIENEERSGSGLAENADDEQLGGYGN